MPTWKNKLRYRWAKQGSNLNVNDSGLLTHSQPNLLHKEVLGKNGVREWMISWVPGRNVRFKSIKVHTEYCWAMECLQTML